MRPLLQQFPADAAVFGLDDQYMLGDALLVRPVMDAGAADVRVYFPDAVWYDVDDYRRLDARCWQTVDVDANKIPVYQRGGSVVVRKERIRRAATLMRDDPLTLVVAVDARGEAAGTVYADDERSFEYRNGRYLYVRLAFAAGELRAERIDREAVGWPSKVWVERVRFVGLERVPRSATLRVGGGTAVTETELEVQVEESGRVVVVRRPAVALQQKEWSIVLNY